jgi:hypothetical protein
VLERAPRPDDRRLPRPGRFDYAEAQVKLSKSESVIMLRGPAPRR